MTAKPCALEAIRQEWENIFSSLPADPNTPTPSAQMEWMDLPQRTWALPAAPGFDGPATAGVQPGVSPALENPPVNPLTGQGRTAADVARDSRAYRAYVRHHGASDTPPVFQSDYVLLTPTGTHTTVACFRFLCHKASTGPFFYRWNPRLTSGGIRVIHGGCACPRHSLSDS